jgi:polysaccharide pyruvyl transferase CsaB
MNRSDGLMKVGISGSYGGLNLGDEAILKSMITQLRRSLPVEITVFSRTPRDTLQRHGVERAIPVREYTRTEISREIERLDLFILGGGGILFDAEAKIYLREVMIAHEKGIPVMTYAVGAGPLEELSVQEAVREALSKAAIVSVRERGAQRTLENAGVEREIIVTADPALLLEPEPLPEDALKREHIAGKRRLVAMSVREPGPAAPDIRKDFYHALLANAADFMVDRYDADIVFIPMERRMRDMQHSHAVVSQMLRPQRAWILKADYTSGQLLSLMKHFDFAVGMRLHFLIFAAIQGIPFIALPYSSKVLGFLEELHIEMPPIDLVSAGRLIAHLDHLWDSKETLRTQIRQALPELQKRALKSNQLALSLLCGAAGKREVAPSSLTAKTFEGEVHVCS